MSTGQATRGRLRWEARVRERAVSLAYRHPRRAPAILFEMLERLERGPIPMTPAALAGSASLVERFVSPQSVPRGREVVAMDDY